MICKYCGTIIAPGAKACPECGKSGSKIEGGNGFWDIARGPYEERLPIQPIIEPEKKTFKSIIPLVICATLCIICLFITIIGAISSNHRINTLKKDYERKLTEQSSLYAEEKPDFLLRIERLEQRLEEISSNSDQETEAFNVRSYPTNETRGVGFQSRPGYYLFGLSVEGPVNSFRWEKQEENGEWLVIGFDEEGRNEELGIRLEEVLSQGISNLVAAGLTSESFGTYRCTIFGNSSSVQIPAVELINMDTSENTDRDSVSQEEETVAEDEEVNADISESDKSSNEQEEDSPEESNTGDGEENRAWWWSRG